MKHIPETLPDGFKYRAHDRLYHVVMSFTDCGDLFYVVKYYGRYKQWWHYEVESDFALKLILKNR